VFWNGRADSLWALNVVVAESATTLNGNRLRTAHQIAERYAAFYDAVFARDFGPLDVNAIGQLPASGNGKSAAFTNLGGTGEPFPTEFRMNERTDQKAMVTRILVNWAKAIAAYEYKLTSGEADFDAFVRQGPDSSAIPPAAKRGARLFAGKAGCTDCHSGPQLTDEKFHNVGVPQTGLAVPTLEDCPKNDDPRNAACDCVSPEALKCAPWGAYDGLRRLRDTTKNSPTQNRWLRSSGWSDDPTDDSRAAYVKDAPADNLKGAWRTPSLRNVALTAPYMHDGRYATLEDVIWHYNTGARNAGAEQISPENIAAQIKPLMLSEDEAGDLVAFLKTLTARDPLPDSLLHSPPDVGMPTGAGGAGGSCTGAGGTTGTAGTSGTAGSTGNTGGTITGSAGVGGGPIGGFGGAGGGVGGSLGGRGAGGSTTITCSGRPPFTSIITDFRDAMGSNPVRFGALPGITGATFTTAPAGLLAPVAQTIPGSNMTNAVLFQLRSAPIDAGDARYRFGLRFDDCVDARAFAGVQFTMTNTTMPPDPTCQIWFGVTSRPSASPSDDVRGVCPAPSCDPPLTAVASSGGVFRIAFTGGSVPPMAGAPFLPSPLVDPASIIGIEWRVPITCNLSVMVDDISFVNP
jgi:cytochrome c peroxidase